MSSREKFPRRAPERRTKQHSANNTASGRHGEKPLARETRFGLIYALSRAKRAPHSDLWAAPFVQLLMRPGHFIFTLRRASARRNVRTTAYRTSSSYLPSFRTRTDSFPRMQILSRRYDATGERVGRAGRKPSEERFFQYTSAATNNRRKNNNCFYSRENTLPSIRTGSSLQGRSASFE